ncbi:hypothetical protein SESBI_10242 [Sesbania bispinosa]|nr:hypothetical protein SESBI_10242 [Sesbania bispinosa]
MVSELWQLLSTMGDPTQDQSSPYYLHPSETPSLTITPNILEGQNHHQWGNTTQNKGSYGRGNNTKVCRHCGKTGHTIDTCYRKHGFPPHFKFKNQGHDESLANVVCQLDNPDDDEQDVGGLKANMQPQQFGFTAEQYQGLLSLLQQSQVRNSVSN